MPENETQKPAAKCPWRMRGDSPCGREPYDDKGWCICHSERPDKDAVAFQREIEAVLECKDYDFTNFVFPGDADFRHTVFDRPARFAWATFQGEAYFFHVTFQGEADFRDATFRVAPYFCAATFQGEANFCGATFHGEAPFERATFDGRADFGFAKFHRTAAFLSARFRGETRFSGATFQDYARFPDATFQGADFRSVTFEGDADFGTARFQRKADFTTATFRRVGFFRWATFQAEARFRDAIFEGEVCFSQATFRGEALFVGREDDWVFSRQADASFWQAHFVQREELVFQHAFLGRTRFLEADVRQLDFTDVEWARRPSWGPRWQRCVERDVPLCRAIRKVCRKWPARLKPRGRFAVWDELTRGEEKDYALIGKLYRQLKHNYEEQRDPITAGDFHFGEMHMRRLANPPRNRVLRFLKRNLSLLALYRWISGYGEDYILALAWVMGMIVVFALAFAYIPALALQPSSSPTGSAPMQGFWSRFWYSVMCFLLRGDRPLQPVHSAGHYLSVAEGVIGPPLIALFILALNRRFKR